MIVVRLMSSLPLLRRLAQLSNAAGRIISLLARRRKTETKSVCNHGINTCTRGFTFYAPALFFPAPCARSLFSPSLCGASSWTSSARSGFPGARNLATGLLFCDKASTSECPTDRSFAFPRESGSQTRSGLHRRRRRIRGAVSCRDLGHWAIDRAARTAYRAWSHARSGRQSHWTCPRRCRRERWAGSGHVAVRTWRSRQVSLRMPERAWWLPLGRQMHECPCGRGRMHQTATESAECCVVASKMPRALRRRATCKQLPIESSGKPGKNGKMAGSGANLVGPPDHQLGARSDGWRNGVVVDAVTATMMIVRTAVQGKHRSIDVRESSRGVGACAVTDSRGKAMKSAHSRQAQSFL